MAKNESNSAHNRAIQALSDARQHVRAYRFELEKANVPDDQVFVQAEQHPQKNMHAALLDYYEEVNEPEYILMMEDIWRENLSDERGRDVKVRVPKNNVVEKTVTEGTINNMIPDLEKIETKEETVSLETLGFRWAGRSVTVRANIDSPYRDDAEKVQEVRLWMPPKILRAAYSQLNSALSKIGLLAQTRAPVDHDPEPI